MNETSVVSKALTNQQLNEMLEYSPELSFAGLSVVVCGDFYQLTPIAFI